MAMDFHSGLDSSIEDHQVSKRELNDAADADPDMVTAVLLFAG